MIRTIIVDDEPLSRQRLCDLLRCEKDVRVIGQYRNGGSAMRDLPLVLPHLIFVDVEMPRITGFDLVQFARTLAPTPTFVFVTAHENYALRAFEEGAVDYLLKPFDAERFSRTMERSKYL